MSSPGLGLGPRALDHDHDLDHDLDLDQDLDHDVDHDKKHPCVRQCAASGGFFLEKASLDNKTLVLGIVRPPPVFFLGRKDVYTHNNSYL